MKALMLCDFYHESLQQDRASHAAAGQLAQFKHEETGAIDWRRSSPDDRRSDPPADHE